MPEATGESVRLFVFAFVAKRFTISRQPALPASPIEKTDGIVYNLGWVPSENDSVRFEPPPCFSPRIQHV